MFRCCLPLICLPMLAACDPAVMGAFPGAAPAGPPTIASQCVARTARSLGVGRGDVTVEQAQSLPEGDEVTMSVAGKGRYRCSADVDGNITQVVVLPGVPVPAPAPATTAPLPRPVAT